jgi:DNA-binding transcriptional LysR family regulator
VEVSYSDRTVDLVADGFDLAVRGGVLEDSVLHATKLRPMTAKLYASAEYQHRRGVPRAPSDLTGHDLVHFSRQPLRLDRDGGRATVKIDPILVTNNPDARVEAALAGLGIAVVPDFAVRPGLIAVLPDWRLFGRRAFWVIRPPDRAPRATVEALSEALVAALRPKTRSV